MTRTLACALLAAGCFTQSLAAQVVRGVVSEDVTSKPLQGAMVILLEIDGTVAHRVLTDATGGFIARVSHPGVYRIRVDRIGYESLVTDRFDVPVEGTVQTVRVPIRPVELTGLEVEASRRCELRAEQGRATAQAWEEARKALEAAAWTLSSGAYRYTLLNFVRTLDPNMGSPREEQRRFVRGTGQAPYVSLPAEDLVENGFIRRNADRSHTFYAPDAEAFLSEAFLDTHCMRLERVKDGRIALAFEPVRGRRASDIRGTLWIDAATAALERLEFVYVNVPSEYPIGYPGGNVVFGALPNGTWIVREWAIRMPIVATNPQRTNMILRGYEEQGGVVWRVIDRSGQAVVEASTASVLGTVVDSTGTAPLPGARVSTPDVGEPVTSGADGSFLMPGLPEGRVVLEAAHPSLDSLGLGPVSAEVETRAGEVATVQLRFPSVRALLEGACSGAPEDGRERATLLGRVRSGPVPAEGALVRLRWLAGSREGFEATARAAPEREGFAPLLWSNDPLDARWLVTSLDSRGLFVLCGVPTGSQVRLEATLGDAPPTVRTLEIPAGATVVTVTLHSEGRSGS